MGCGKSSVGRKLSQLLCCSFMDLDAVIETQTGRSIPEIFASDGETAFRDIERDVLTDVLSATMAVSSRGPLPQTSCGPLPLAGGGKMPLTHDSHAPQKAHSSKIPLILSLGGGTVMTPECAELVRENTTCIYLRASVDTLASRLASEAEGRPLLNPAHNPGSTYSDKSPNSRPHSGAPDRDHSPKESASDLRPRIESLMSRRASTYEATAHLTLDTDGLSIEEIAQMLVTNLRTVR